MDITNYVNDFLRSFRVLRVSAPELLCFGITGLLMFIAWCRLLAKAGLPWERMFVPFLGTYSQYSVANCGGLFWASVILVSVTAMMYLVSTVLGAILAVGTGICLFIFYIVHCAKLAAAYGRGGGFATGLVFLYPIFILILGFGSSTYYLFADN